VKKFLAATVAVLALASPAHADSTSSSTAFSLKSRVFYYEVCPYGILKTPSYNRNEDANNWAYIPDSTKRQATKEVYQLVEDIGIETFCKRADAFFDKNWGKLDESQVELEKKLPKVYATVTDPARLTDSKYRFYLTAVNNSDTARDTEWTCQLSNPGKVVVKEWKVAIPNVGPNSRVITTQTVVEDVNVDTIFCK
jgi:hypothetical protein